MNTIKYLLLSVGITLLFLSCNNGDMTCTCEIPGFEPVVTVCIECEGTAEGDALEEDCLEAQEIIDFQGLDGGCILTID